MKHPENKSLFLSLSPLLLPLSQQSSDNLPPGYEAISLLEALNGICSVPSIPSTPLYGEIQFPGDAGDPLALSRPQSMGDLPGDASMLKGKGSKSPDR